VRLSLVIASASLILLSGTNASAEAIWCPNGYSPAHRACRILIDPLNRRYPKPQKCERAACRADPPTTPSDGPYKGQKGVCVFECFQKLIVPN
jgi:hypothetical protein